MKVYDPSRYAHQTCRYGCCQPKKGLKLPAYVRRARKAARRLSRVEIRLALGL